MREKTGRDREYLDFRRDKIPDASGVAAAPGVA